MTTPPIIPLRLQRSRRKGSRLVSPNGLPIINCDRSGPLGNPFVGVGAADIFRKYMNAKGSFQCEIGNGLAMAFVPAFDHPKQVREMLARVPRIDGQVAANFLCWCRLCPKHTNGKPLSEKCPDCAPCHCDVLGDLILSNLPKRSRTVQFVHADGTPATSKTQAGNGPEGTT